MADLRSAVRERAKKGSVKVENLRGMLRLVWSRQGRRYYLSLGLRDTPVNRSAAEFKAAIIERDIAAENFDTSLKRYGARVDGEKITAVELIERYMKSRAPYVDPLTIDRMGGLRNHLESHLKSQASEVTESDAVRFCQYLTTVHQPVTLSGHVTTLRAVWRWGIKQGLVESNPWLDIQVKRKGKRAPRPFTKDEATRIKEAFRRHPRYSHYADYVDFLFSTGCRTGEAIGLRWKDLSGHFGTVWFGEILTRGGRKDEKRKKPRTIGLPPTVQAMLQRRHNDRCQPDDLIFYGVRGGPINSDYFTRSAWADILKELGIEYRKPYCTRATLISHAIEAGMNPVDVAYLVGNTPKVIFEHYAGLIRRPQLPDLMTD